jgi:hypothetical protein
MVEKALGCAYATAKNTISELESLNLLRETTGFKRNKRYEYAPYMSFWREAQDDTSDIDTANVTREKFLRAINHLRQSQPSVALSIKAGEEQWTVVVDDLEICKLDPWVYNRLVQPMHNYRNEPDEKKRFLERQFFLALSDVLERILEFGPEPEFDADTVYEIRAVGKAATAKVSLEGDLLRFDFHGGDFVAMMNAAKEFRIPWQFDFMGPNGKLYSSKLGRIAEFGMSNGSLWMTVAAEKNIPMRPKSRAEKPKISKLSEHYLVIDGTQGPIRLWPLTFYHTIFERAYNVPGLEPWHANDDKIQSMNTALERLNTLGRFEIFAFPEENAQFLEAAPAELKPLAKAMSGL